MLFIESTVNSELLESALSACSGDKETPLHSADE